MTKADIEYFRARADAERALAKASADQKVAEVHEELAQRYETLAGCSRPHLVPV